MKANNGKGNVESRDDWETPQELWDKLDKQYNFNYDCCANKENHKCKNWYPDFLFLAKNDFIHRDDWMFWMNPPFSKAYEMFSHFFKVVNKGVAIYRCDNMETKVWQEVILKHASWVFIPKGRIKYAGHQGKGSRFPSALIGFNVEVPDLDDGKILYIKE